MPSNVAQKHTRAYYMALEQYRKCVKEGKFKSVTVEEFEERVYEKKTSSMVAKFIPETIVIFNQDFMAMQPWKPAELRMIFKIGAELKLNNCLWYYDHVADAYDRTVMASLRRAGLVLKTDDPRIHYINPDYIRRGTKPFVLACMVDCLKNTVKVNMDHIRDLGYKKNRIDFSLLDVQMIPLTIQNPFTDEDTHDPGNTDTNDNELQKGS